MIRLFKSAAGMGLTSARYARLGQAHTGDLQKRRYTNPLCQSARLQGRLHSVQFACITDAQVWSPASAIVDEHNLDLFRMPALRINLIFFFSLRGGASS